MQFSDIIQEKSYYLCCYNSSMGQNKMSSFQHKVHNCHYYIISKRLRKFYNQYSKHLTESLGLAADKAYQLEDIT